MGGTRRGLGHVVVQPAQLELVPGGHVAGQVTDAVLAGAEPGAGRHQRPEADRVLGGVGRVVQVRQTEVVAVLVGEDAQAAVLGLCGVVADPDAGVADLGAAGLVVGRAGRAGVGAVGVPAVRPDGVGALDAAARGLVLTGVHDLEVIDVAVGLVEVAVVVEVVAVPLVVLGEIGLDLLGRTALGLLVGGPGVHAVLDHVPGVGAVGRTAVVRAVAGLVVRDLDPVGDLAVDRVASGGRLLVVRLERVLAGTLAEVQLLEVGLVVIGLPGGAVVLLGVRLGYLVVRRSRRAAVLRDGRLGAVAVRVEHGRVVDLVAELHQDGEDLVGLLPAELDVLLVVELDDLGAAARRHLLVAGYDLFQRGLTLGVLLLAERALQVVRVALGRPRVPAVYGGGGGA